MVWSIAYALLLKHAGALGVAKALLVGSAAAQMYYVLVYAQLVVLTPLLYRLLRACPAVPHAVGILALVGREAVALAGINLPQVQAIFAVWIIFYVVGLDWERWRGYVEGKAAHWAVAVVVAIGIQEGFGFAWNAFGDYNMATTQLKLSSMIASLAAIGLIMAMPVRLKARAGGYFPRQAGGCVVRDLPVPHLLRGCPGKSAGVRYVALVGGDGFQVSSCTGALLCILRPCR